MVSEKSIEWDCAPRMSLQLRRPPLLWSRVNALLYSELMEQARQQPSRVLLGESFQIKEELLSLATTLARILIKQDASLDTVPNITPSSI